jgi:protein-S-isoprenylcysteine O-methyltransferase Ste14
VALTTADTKAPTLEERLFEQFKENLSLAGETPREGLKSAQAAWRNATPTKRAVWLLVPTVIVVSAVAEHFSVPWYYEAAGILVLVVGSSWLLRAMRRKLQ